MTTTHEYDRKRGLRYRLPGLVLVPVDGLPGWCYAGWYG